VRALPYIQGKGYPRPGLRCEGQDRSPAGFYRRFLPGLLNKRCQSIQIYASCFLSYEKLMTQIQSQQLTRLFRLLGLLRSGKRYAVGELAEVCSASRRAILRDIQLLREFDYPVAVDSRTQTWYMTADGPIPPSQGLTSEEAALLALAAELSPLRHAPAVAAKIASALAKILEQFPQPQSEEIRRLVSLCELEGGHLATRADTGDSLLAVLYALRSGKNLRVTYREADDAVTTTRMIPHRLAFSGNAWHLIGRSQTGRKPLRLEVTRIRHAVPVDEAEWAQASNSLTGSEAHDQ
jgi:predicted DNA-binding transcriptional regulator YafY